MIPDKDFKRTAWPVSVLFRTANGIGLSITTEKWGNHYFSMIEKWCDQTYGAENWEYYFGDFLFKNKEDATLFTLRWA